MYGTKITVYGTELFIASFAKRLAESQMQHFEMLSVYVNLKNFEHLFKWQSSRFDTQDF